MRLLFCVVVISLISVFGHLQAQTATSALPVGEPNVVPNPVGITQIENAYLLGSFIPSNNNLSSLQSGNGNDGSIAQVAQYGFGNVAAIWQFYGENQASVHQTGSGNVSGIVQSGLGNYASTTINGNSNLTLIRQYGNNNSAVQNITLNSSVSVMSEQLNVQSPYSSPGSQSYYLIQMGNNNSISEIQGSSLSKPYGVTQVGNNLHLIIQDWTFPSTSK